MLGVAAFLILQQVVGVPKRPVAGALRLVQPPTATTVQAVRAERAPVIDGKDDDPIWATAPAIWQFRRFSPKPDSEATYRTEAKVVYDAANLYVFVRAYDPHPDRIVLQHARRDTYTPTDWIGVNIDSYHDRHTGYGFWVSPAGVMLDFAYTDPSTVNQAWNGVWNVATQIDAQGWTAEFRIPLYQLGYGPEREHTFGIQIQRSIYLLTESDAWPRYDPDIQGLVKQFGDLTGLIGLSSEVSFEPAPDIVARSASTISNNTFGRALYGTAGGDLKVHVKSNVTLDVTLNPDFGQVEADPAVVNLNAYEWFYDEQRPFFVAGKGLFQFDFNCPQAHCDTEEGLYYSRRIGRTPQLAEIYGDSAPQQPTMILPALSGTGQWRTGTTFGFLDAQTARAAGPADTTIEPATNFFLARVRQDLDRGALSVGGIITAVHRSLDAFSAPYLDRSAYAGGLDFRYQLPNGMYEISGSLDHSWVTGSASAIDSIQTDAVHYYQRPDGGLPFDTTRTSLSGVAEELQFAKLSGDHFKFSAAYQRRSAGFEINDLGYLQRADQQSLTFSANIYDRKPNRLYQELDANLTPWLFWTAAGLPLDRGLNGSVQLMRKHDEQWSAGVTVGGLGATYDDRAARGGPAVRQSPYGSLWGSVSGDRSKPLTPSITLMHYWGDAEHSNATWSVSPAVSWKPSSRFNTALSLDWSRGVFGNQWYGNYRDSTGTTHYTFAYLSQTTLIPTLRFNLSPLNTLSLQGYAQPFISRMAYANVRQLSATPRAASYNERYAAYGDTSVTNNPARLTDVELQWNLVLLWEYRPGSRLFVVWSQGRQGTTPFIGDGSPLTEFPGLLRPHPAGTLLVKWSPWWHLNL